MARKLTRRRFLQGSASAIAMPYIIPSGLLGATGRPGPNERINIGHIGVGRRARQLMRTPEGGQIVAAADVNRERLKEMKSRPGNKDWKTYQDYRDMLADDSIDAVIIASPDHWHAIHSVEACMAGKHVYVEKPMTLTIAEGRTMVNAARKYDRIVQCGAQQRSMEKNRFACELIRNGRIGEVHTVHGSNYPSPWDCPLPEQDAPEHIDWDMWCGQTTPRGYHDELYLPRVRGHEAGWISYTPYSGGEMTGWGAHGLDQIQWALGMDDSGPVAVWPHPDQAPPNDGIHMGPTCPVSYKFPNGTHVILDGKGGGGGGFFEGSEGTIDIDRDEYTLSEGVDTSPIPEDGVHLYRVEDKIGEYKGGDTEKHIANWLWCIRHNERPIADVEIAHHATILCHLGNIARWVGRELKWDAKNERFVDDDEANTYLAREQRPPYGMPELT